MKKQFLKTLCLSGLAVAAMASMPMEARAENTGYRDVVESKVYIVGGIADKREIAGTMESLELAGMTGAFVVSPEELRKYPETVKLITTRGHKVVVQLSQGSNNTVEKPAANTTNTAKAAAKPIARPIVANSTKPISQPNTPKTVQPVGKPAAVNANNTPKITKPVSVSANEKVIEAKPAAGTPRQSLAKQMDGETKSAPKATVAATKLVEKPLYKEPTQVAMKASGRNLEEKPVSAKPMPAKSDKKAVIARDFFGIAEDGNRIQVHTPATAKNREYVPDWALESLARLEDDGLFAPDSVMAIQSEPDREMLAKYIIRAKINNENKKPAHYKRNLQDLEKLTEEFDTELCNLGYKATPNAKVQPRAYDTTTKIRGEIREHYVDNDGHKDFKRFDHRTRVRLYVEQPVAKDWAIIGMGEADKSWIHDDPHGNVKLERLYVSGKIADTSVRAGRFGELYADGNIYDGRIDGISVEIGEKVKVHASAGRLRDKEKGGAVSVKYSDRKFDAQAGVHSFNNVKSIGKDTIISAGGNYYIGNFALGGMFLAASEEGRDDGQVGIVGSVRYGRNRSWVPGTYEIFARYYNQPESTYIGHTMVGLADRMHGFKGYGVGMYYTLAPNLVYGLEYYDLKERSSDKNGRTIWNHVSYYF